MSERVVRTFTNTERNFHRELVRVLYIFANSRYNARCKDEYISISVVFTDNVRADFWMHVRTCVSVTTHVKEIRGLGGGNEVAAEVEKGRRRVGNAVVAWK